MSKKENVLISKGLFMTEAHKIIGKKEKSALLEAFVIYTALLFTELTETEKKKVSSVVDKMVGLDIENLKMFIK